MTMLNAADKIAINPTSSANFVTREPFLGITPSSINLFNRSGVAIVKSASTTNATKKRAKMKRYGTAYFMILLKVPGFSFTSLTD